MIHVGLENNKARVSRRADSSFSAKFPTVRFQQGSHVVSSEGGCCLELFCEPYATQHGFESRQRFGVLQARASLRDFLLIRLRPAGR